MKRKRVILILLFFLVCAGLFAAILFLQREPREITSHRMEELRDQLKVYKDTEAETPAVTEETDPPETEETAAETESELPETEPPETASPETDPETEPEPEETEEITESESAAPPETEVPETEKTETTPVSTEQLLDFTKIQQTNPEIYAWIEIEDTKVDYPIVQSSDNDKKYLNTAHNGVPYIGGSIFTESAYNAKDFNDPVTMIYGHTMRSGILFGQLQAVYSDPESFREHSEIKISLDGEVRKYTVFAAVPYEKYHILHVYDFSTPYWYNQFFKNVRKIRDFRANFNEDAFPEAGDRVIILSTCLTEDSGKRFLVMAILQDDLES